MMSNSIFFFTLFLLSLGLSLIPPFLQESLNWLYFFHAFFQLLASASILFSLDFAFQKKAFHPVFIAFSFFLFLIEVTHLTMARLMDSTVGYLFQFLFGGGISNLLPAWESLNLNGWMVVAIGLILGIIPIGAIGFYRLTDRGLKTPFSIGIALVALGIVGELSLPPLPSNGRALPWGNTVISNQNTYVLLPAPFKSHRQEPRHINHTKLEHLPNIYLFIVETFRRDFITPETAPVLSQFGATHLYPTRTHANANSTFPSWFSILHANFPHHWAAMRDTWNHGSIPLRMLKQLGYELCIYSSADLKYFHLDELLFGKNRKLIDQMFEASGKEAWARDAACIDRFEQTLSKQGRCHIFFLDATHSEYSIPPDFPAPFQPAPDRIDYLIIDPRNVAPLQNRYRNAIRYIDSLFSRFLGILEKNQLLEEAMVVVTGDHGEEFFEDGSLFHGTHLNEAQTSVPIIYKLPQPPGKIAADSTHLDILPTILHSLTGIDDFSHLFDGESVFKKDRRPFRLAIHHNCASTPTEFLLEESGNSCHFRVIDAHTVEMLSDDITLLIDGHATKDLLQTDFSSKEAYSAAP